MEESICEPEQGEILGESEDEDLKAKTSSEAKGSHGFKSDNLWMFAGKRQLVDGMTTGIQEREIEVMKLQLQVMEEWLQEQKDQNGKWIFPLKGKRVIWRQLQRRLRQIEIALLKKELRVLVPEMGIEDSKCRLVRKEAVKNEKSHDLKTNELRMFAGTE